MNGNVSPIRSKALLRSDSNLLMRSALQPFTILRRMLDLYVCERSFSVFERLMSVCGLIRSETLMKRSGKLMERPRTAINVGRSRTIILYMVNGPKRLQNHVHVSNCSS